MTRKPSSASCIAQSGKDLLALHSALEELARLDARQALMVESRFFGGLEINEIAELLHVSEATVIRDWRAAKACLLEMIYRFYLLKWSWHRLIRRLVAVMAGVLSAGLMTMSSRFDSREEAEAALKALSRELGKFRLRLNPKKTTIARLPQATQDEWQESLRRSGTGRLSDNSRNMVQHFDNAFRLRESFRDEAVLMYGLGLLFRIVCPTVDDRAEVLVQEK